VAQEVLVAQVVQAALVAQVVQAVLPEHVLAAEVAVVETVLRRLLNLA
jgi:hypothetical protein